MRINSGTTVGSGRGIFSAATRFHQGTQAQQNPSFTTDAQIVHPVADDSVVPDLISDTDTNGVTLEAIALAFASVLGEANGATTDTTIATGSFSTTDSNGATIEIGTVAVTVSLADTNGVATEIIVPLAVYTIAEANSAVVESATGVVAPTVIVASDTNVAALETVILGMRASVSDANSTDSENTIVGVFLSGSDVSSSSVENSVEKSLTFSADSGNALEISSEKMRTTGDELSTSLEVTDLKALTLAPDTNGVDSESASYVSPITSIDFGSSVDESNLSVNEIFTEGVSTVDDANVNLVIIGSETGSSEDGSVGAVSIESGDTGSSTLESVFNEIILFGSDSVFVSEALNLKFNSNATETATASETTLQGQVSTESGSGAENGSQSVLVGASDEGLGTSTAAMKATWLLSDAGYAISTEVVSFIFLDGTIVTDIGIRLANPEQRLAPPSSFIEISQPDSPISRPRLHSAKVNL